MKYISVLIFAFILLSGCTVKPPKEAFPQQVGRFRLSREPLVMKSDLGNGKYFHSSYNSPDQQSISYLLFPFSSSDEAKKGLQRAKQKLEIDYPNQFQFLQETDSRFVIIEKDTGGASAYLVAGDKLIALLNDLPADVVEFESNLPYAAYGVSKPSPQPTVKPDLNFIPILSLLDEFNRSAETVTTRHNNKRVLLSGLVDSTGTIKDGRPFVGFKKPEAKTYEQKEGAITSLFTKDQESAVLAFKKGQQINFRCVVIIGLGLLITENCTLY